MNDNELKSVLVMNSAKIVFGTFFLVLVTMFVWTIGARNQAQQLYFERATQVAELQIAASNVNVIAQRIQKHQQTISGIFNNLIALDNKTIDAILTQGGVRVVDAQGNQTFPPVITLTETDTTTGE